MEAIRCTCNTPLSLHGTIYAASAADVRRYHTLRRTSARGCTTHDVCDSTGAIVSLGRCWEARRKQEALESEAWLADPHPFHKHGDYPDDGP